MPAARRGRLWPGTVPRPPRKRLRLCAEPSRRFRCGSHRIDANYEKVNRNMYFRGTTFSQICHPRTNHFNDLRPTLRSQVSKISLALGELKDFYPYPSVVTALASGALAKAKNVGLAAISGA